MIKKSGAKRRYKFTDKSQSVGGIFSTSLAVAASILTIAGVTISYQNRGDGGRIIGLFGITAIFLSIAGFYMGIRSFQEEEIFFLFSWIGTIWNAILVIGMFLLILMAI